MNTGTDTAQPATKMNLTVQQQINLLRRFEPFKQMSDRVLVVLTSQLEILHLRSRDHFVKIGESDERDYYLLEGEVKAIAADQREFDIQADSKRSLTALANLRPRKYDLVTTEDCTFLTLPHETIGLLAEQLKVQQDHENSDIYVGPMQTDHIIAELEDDLEHDRLRLPSLPTIALKIKQVVEDPESDIHSIATIVKLDPVISAKLVESANSPVYRGIKDVSTVLDAISRLGKEITRQLVLIFAVREIFHSDNQGAVALLQKLWDECTEVAAICHVLAAKSQLDFDPEVALMAGLLHRIGEVPIYTYSANYQELLDDLDSISRIAHSLGARIGERIIKRWHLDPVLVEVVKQQGNWFKQATAEIDYADLVIVAQLHAQVHHGATKELPNLDQVEAFKRIQVGELTPELSIHVLEEAQDELEAARNLLRAH